MFPQTLDEHVTPVCLVKWSYEAIRQDSQYPNSTKEKKYILVYKKAKKSKKKKRKKRKRNEKGSTQEEKKERKEKMKKKKKEKKR
jgi:hypothetical protein